MIQSMLDGKEWKVVYSKPRNKENLLELSAILIERLLRKEERAVQRHDYSTAYACR
jgi:hypothetical protein